MKKKLLLSILAICMSAFCLLGVTACDDEHVHTVVTDSAVSATCTTTGLTEGSHCSTCNQVIVAQQEVPLVAHTLGNLVDEVSATCLTTGVKAHKTCSVCEKNFDADGNEITDLQIPTTAHAFGAWIDEDPATCLATGVKGHKVCSVCDKNFDADGVEITDLTIAIGGHAFGEWVDEIPATCLATGVKGYKACSVCDKKFDAEGVEITDLTITIGGHAFGEWIDEIPATLTATGVKGHQICSVCEKKFDAEGVEITNLVINKLNLNQFLEGKKISFLGDSITSYEGITNSTSVNDTLRNYYTYYTSSGNVAVSDTWWQQTVDTWNMELLVNNSYSGSCTADGKSNASAHPTGIINAWESRCVNLHDNTTSNNPNNAVINPDIIAVFMGTNDTWGQNAEGTWTKVTNSTFNDAFFARIEANGFVPAAASFDEAYALMIYKMTVAYPNADIFCLTIPLASTTFNNAIKAIAEHYGCGLVDLYDTELRTNKSAVTSDNVHPNATGMDIITDALSAAFEDFYGVVPHVHTEVIDQAVEATCTTTGLTAGSHCSTCNETIIAQQEVPVLSHAFGAWIAETPATCTQSGIKGHKTCSSCNKNFDNEGNVISVLVIASTGHSYGAWVEEVSASCTATGVKAHKTCSKCGKHFNSSNQVIADLTIPENHNYTIEEATYETYADSATATSGALFYKTCSTCGAIGSETFTYGDPVTDSSLYDPTSITLSFYDTEDLKYGVNYITDNEPLLAVLEIKENGASSWNKYDVTSASYQNYTEGVSGAITRYKNFTVIDLTAGANYVYRIRDLVAGTTTEDFAFTAKNPNTTSFSFTSISDTQSKIQSAWPDYTQTGMAFNDTLSHASPSDFYLHGGDIVQYGRFENYWDDMLDYNREYLATTPLMAVAGNHDGDPYYAGGSGNASTHLSNHLTNHFNYNLPTQAETKKGAFYYFDYGNARFINLDTNTLTNNKLNDEQMAWLESVLDNNDKTWTIVNMHVPLYSAAEWGQNTARNQITLALQEQLADFFYEKGVDLVIQAHDHVIQRTNAIKGYGSSQNPIVDSNPIIDTVDGVPYKVNPDGVCYMMNGSAGVSQKGNYLASGTEPDYYEIVMAWQTVAWAEIEIDGNTLTVTQKTYNYSQNTQTYTLKTLDTWGIKKTV